MPLAEREDWAIIGGNGRIDRVQESELGVFPRTELLSQHIAGQEGLYLPFE
jgi:hypothetical protein